MAFAQDSSEERGRRMGNAQGTVDGKLASSQKPDEIPAFNQGDYQFL
jgi:hypothetical protein